AATARPAQSGRNRKHARLIVGLISEATGPMVDDMRRALEERRELIEKRADSVLAAAIAESAPWLSDLGPEPLGSRHAVVWRRGARVVAAYRDRYGVASEAALGG